MVNGLHLYSAFIQSALQFLPLIHPFTHTFTHQRRLAAMQGTNQLVRSNWGLVVLLRDTSTRPGWDRTGNPPTARRQLYLLSHIAPLIVFSLCLCVIVFSWCYLMYDMIHRFDPSSMFSLTPLLPVSVGTVFNHLLVSTSYLFWPCILPEPH